MKREEKKEKLLIDNAVDKGYVYIKCPRLRLLTCLLYILVIVHGKIGIQFQRCQILVAATGIRVTRSSQQESVTNLGGGGTHGASAPGAGFWGSAG